ncbi:hypothetical protein F4780DRAFT_184270 [Xylariomycetidae sp. FL0641]|nr:hypothetical protein F4780DRAFT_184270 [Xylariomycetidae sp. FL0641]
MHLQARAAVHYLGRGGEEKEEEELVAEAVEWLCKLQVNSFNRLDADVGQAGLFLNPALAMVNHSCVPNAFVQFHGRVAMLHASQEIREGEEVVISYIENHLPRSQRREALKARYHFDCSCVRCRDDLDVYQVCQRYPHLDLNHFSLVPEVQNLREPPIIRSGALSRDVETLYSSCSGPLHGQSLPDRAKAIRSRWQTCADLRKANMFAIEPLTQVLVEASMYFSEQERYEYSLAISCFLALHSDPYRAPMPFAPQRVKGLLMVAKLLANTGPANPSSGTGGRCSSQIKQALSEMDQATMCQVVLMLVMHYAPAAHSKEWAICQEAMALLNDLESLPGRETEQALVRALVRNPSAPEERRFFETAVLKPIQKLSEFALPVMTEEFGS